MDSVVASGRCSVDERALSGEALPVIKLPGMQSTTGRGTPEDPAASANVYVAHKLAVRAAAASRVQASL